MPRPLAPPLAPAGLLTPAGFLALAALFWAVPAHAYRPFDGTDAGVANLEDIEIESQPLGYFREGSARSLIAPQWVLNFGFAPTYELVLQGQINRNFAGTEAWSFEGSQVNLKHVWVEGVLQDKPGVSVATEFALLTPGIGVDRGTGFAADTIISQRFEWGTAHINIQPGMTRDQRADLFFSTILEGPEDWRVRPVTEILYEKAFGQFQQKSLLVGAIYKVDERLSFDAALRFACVDRTAVSEIRLGFTVAFPETSPILTRSFAAK